MNAGATLFAMETDIPEEQKISPAGLFAGGALSRALVRLASQVRKPAEAPLTLSLSPQARLG
jgi:hypothetical protein